MINVLNEMYSDFIMRSLVVQCAQKQFDSSYFLSVYHTPVDVLNNLEVGDLLQLF